MPISARRSDEAQAPAWPRRIPAAGMTCRTWAATVGTDAHRFPRPRRWPLDRLVNRLFAYVDRLLCRGVLAPTHEALRDLLQRSSRFLIIGRREPRWFDSDYVRWLAGHLRPALGVATPATARGAPVPGRDACVERSGCLLSNNLSHRDHWRSAGSEVSAPPCSGWVAGV